MSWHSLNRRLLVAIAAITVVSGLVQMLAPGFVLSVIGGSATPASRHFFGIVGMFMVLFGGALLHALVGPVEQPVVVLWASLQKLGAAAAVGLGALKGIFSPLALGVAGFDLLSGLLGFCYWAHIRGAPRAAQSFAREPEAMRSARR